MKLIDIYNMALSVFMEPPVTAEEFRNGQGHNLQVLKAVYQPAVIKARDEHSWSWLEEIIELQKEDGSMAGYDYVYTLPDGVKLVEIMPREAEYRRIGNRILSKQEIETCIGINTDDVEPTNDNIPDEFWILVSYAMAFLASESMSNNNQVTIQVVASKYNSYLEQMKLQDITTSMRTYSNGEQSYL